MSHIPCMCQAPGHWILRTLSDLFLKTTPLDPTVFTHSVDESEERN